MNLIVQDCIKNIAKEEDLKSYHVDVNDFSTSGGNFVGNLQTVDIKNEDGDKEINIFIKNAPDKDIVFSMAEVYRRESFIYNDLFKKYNQLQEDFKIPKHERFNIVKSYGGVNSEVIILENLSKLGFETRHRKDVFSLTFAESSLSQLAKFHGLSFALEQMQPKYFKNHVNTIKCTHDFGHGWQSYVRKTFDIAIEVLEGEAKDEFKKFSQGFVEKFVKYNHLSDEEAVCLCHGDFKQNNILVKDINCKKIEAFIIDYQFVSFTSPVLDLILFIIGGSDQEFRSEHMEHLKDLYYRSLENFLKYFNINAKDVYSRTRFENEFKDKLDFGLITSVIVLPFLLTTDVPDVTSGADSLKFNLDDEYEKRIRELVDFYMQNGYL